MNPRVRDTMNTTHPGLADYTGPTSGLFGLLHHDRLFEWSDDVTERVGYIVANKSASEQAVRLRCLVYLDPAGQPWAEGTHLRAEGLRLLTEGTHLRAEGLRLLTEGTRLRAEGLRLLTEGTRLRAEATRLLETHRQAQAIELQIRSLVPDLPWDGSQLVFDGKEDRP